MKNNSIITLYFGSILMLISAMVISFLINNDTPNPDLVTNILLLLIFVLSLIINIWTTIILIKNALKKE